MLVQIALSQIILERFRSENEKASTCFVCERSGTLLSLSPSIRAHVIFCFKLKTASLGVKIYCEKSRR